VKQAQPAERLRQTIEPAPLVFELDARVSVASNEHGALQDIYLGVGLSCIGRKIHRVSV
jgi:hypothetical protein